MKTHSVGIAPLILKLRIKWRWVVSLIHQLLYPQYPLNRKMGEPLVWSGCFGDKSLTPARIWIQKHPACTLITILIMLLLTPTFILQQWLKFNLCSLQYGTHHYCLQKTVIRGSIWYWSLPTNVRPISKLSHGPGKYQNTEIIMLHWDVSSMKNVTQRKFLRNEYDTYFSLSAKIKIKTFKLYQLFCTH